MDPDSIGSLDPDPGPDLQSESGSRRAKMTHKLTQLWLKVVKSRDTDPFDILGERAFRVCESSIYNANSACYSVCCGIFILARSN